MENNLAPGAKGPSRRSFLAATAVTAVAAPIVTGGVPAAAGTAAAGSARTRRPAPDELRAMLR